jgi:hypothetical protein
LILANTEGSWFRSRSNEETMNHPPYSDLVIMSVSKENGTFQAPGPLLVPPPATSPGSQLGSMAGGTKPRRVGFLALAVVGLVVFGIIIFVRMNRQPQELVETDRSKVLAYLKDFDVEDIDLRHSATGGWHCTYASNPAEKEHYRYFGIGGDEDDDDEEDRRLNQGKSSGIVRDGAYIDPLHAPLAPISPALLGRSSTLNRGPTVGGRKSPSASSTFTDVSLLSGDSESTKRLRRRGGNYHGLLDAYNDSSLQPLGGDIEAEPVRSKPARSRSMNEETWGKEII